MKTLKVLLVLIGVLAVVAFAYSQIYHRAEPFYYFYHFGRYLKYALGIIMLTALGMVLLGGKKKGKNETRKQQ